MSEKELVKVQFCIPPLGTEIILAEPWTFMLYKESRNRTLITNLGLKYEEDYSVKKIKEITIPRGSKLSISRIYIRNGLSEFDSVTFYLKKYFGNSKIKGRFWAKLHDVNKMVCFPIGKDIDVDSVFESFRKNKEKFLAVDDEL